MNNELVSIIMLSYNNAKYVEESVRSVINQTYHNWELIFVDDNSKDDSLNKILELRKDAIIKRANGAYTNRISVSQTVTERGDVINSNSALKAAKGRWIAFLNVGDVWAPNKLERQIEFMKEHGYGFSYHQYRLIDDSSEDRGFLISGKKHVAYKDMLKCCWPGYMTVMYDVEKVGKMSVRSVWTNYYALWLGVSKKSDCFLLEEPFAAMRTKWVIFGKIFLTNSFKWKYDAYRLEEGMGRILSMFYAMRNGLYGLGKWYKYVKRTSAY